MLNRITRAFFVSAGNFKDAFSHSRCVLPISVGQHYYTKEKFQAIVDIINHHFQECLIVVCDALQRHTLPLFSDIPLEKIHEEAIRQGDLWLAENRSIFDLLSIDYSVTRWNDWLCHTNFQRNKHLIDNFFDNNAKFRTAVSETTHAFLKRHLNNKNNDASYSIPTLEQYCINYLKEECAVMPLWAEIGIDFELYPAKQNKALEFARQHLVFTHYPEKLRFIQVNFRTRERPAIFSDQAKHKNTIQEILFDHLTVTSV